MVQNSVDFLCWKCFHVSNFRQVSSALIHSTLLSRWLLSEVWNIKSSNLSIFSTGLRRGLDYIAKVEGTVRQVDFKSNISLHLRVYYYNNFFTRFYPSFTTENKAFWKKNVLLLHTPYKNLELGWGDPHPLFRRLYTKQSYSMPVVCRLYVAAGVSNTRIGARAFVASSHHVHGKHCTMRKN